MFIFIIQFLDNPKIKAGNVRNLWQNSLTHSQSWRTLWVSLKFLLSTHTQVWKKKTSTKSLNVCENTCFHSLVPNQDALFPWLFSNWNKKKRDLSTFKCEVCAFASPVRDRISFFHLSPGRRGSFSRTLKYWSFGRRSTNCKSSFILRLSIKMSHCGTFQRTIQIGPCRSCAQINEGPINTDTAGRPPTDCRIVNSIIISVTGPEWSVKTRGIVFACEVSIFYRFPQISLLNEGLTYVPQKPKLNKNIKKTKTKICPPSPIPDNGIKVPFILVDNQLKCINICVSIFLSLAISRL